MNSGNRIRIALYTQLSFVAEGLAAVFHTHADLELVACRDGLSGTLDCLKSTRPDVLLVHLPSGVKLSELQEIWAADSRCQIVLWGQELEGEFAFQAIRLGVRDILPGNVSIDDLLAALRNVHQGALCFEKDLLESMLSQKRGRSHPTSGADPLVGGARPQKQGNSLFAGNYRRHGKGLSV